MTTIFKYCCTDILCVRGVKNEARGHFGNMRYHQVLLKYSNKYNEARSCERKQLVDEISDEILQDGNTRFLKQKKGTAGHCIFWEEMNKKSICKKIRRALEVVVGESKASKKEKAHSSPEDRLASRRMKARHRYASMTPDQHRVYTSKVRERYHISRAKRCEKRSEDMALAHDDDSEDMDSKEAAICLLQMGAMPMMVHGGADDNNNNNNTNSTDDDIDDTDDTDDTEDTDNTNENDDTDDIRTTKRQQEPMKQREKNNVALADPAVRGIEVEDAIKLIAVVIADLKIRHKFVERLLRDYFACKDKGESHSEEYVFFPGLTRALINEHLGKSLPGTTIFLKTTSTIPSNSSAGDGDEGSTTLVCGDDFSTWYLVEGTTDKNFQDAPAHHHYRPTVQSFLKEPGFLDCHPRKGVPPTTMTASDRKDVMEQRDLMAISLATSSVFTRLGPRGNHWPTDRFKSDFIPYPMSWLGSVITRLSSTTGTVAESTMTRDNDPRDGQSTFSFTIGKKGSLLTSTQKVWGIRYANDATTSKTTTTTTTTIGTTTQTTTTTNMSRTTLQAIQTPDDSYTFFPPDIMDGHSVDGDTSIRRDEFARALKNNNKTSKPRCRQYVDGALHRDLELPDRGPLLWEPRKHGDLDLDIFVMDQLKNKSSSPYYTTSRISVRRVDFDGNKENKQFLESCNSIGRHHASEEPNCRKHNSDSGKMFGFGYHLYNGGIKKFQSKLCKKRVREMLKQAKKVLEPLFPHQLISMRAMERGLLNICTKSTMPQAFNQSVDLGNASHVDVMDGSAGMSMWTELKPGTAKNWYFVLPNLVVTHNGVDYVGVVIKLDHGTAISWDGRLIRHCTSVTDVNGGDIEGENHVFGTFFSTKANTVGAQMNRSEILLNYGIVHL
jgi:hypothetical protein